MRVAAPMNRFSRPLGGVLLATAMLGLTSCLDLNPNTEACSVTIAPTNISVPVNGRQQTTGTAFDCKGNSIKDKKISYSTANAAIATVAQDGSVIGISVGQTSVTATANKGSATAQVTVTPEVVSTVSINPPSITLRVTNSRTFQAVLRNAGGTIITKPVQWSSGNTGVATVSQTGVVTAVRPGQVQIVAEVDQVLGASTVTVTEIPITACSLSPATQKVTVNGQVQPTLTIRDSTGAILEKSGRAITWQSDNEVVATVNATGLVTTRRAGTAKITALSSENPAVSCATSVEAVDARVDKVVILQPNLTLRLGLPRGMGVLVLDSAGNQITGRQVFWTSVNPTIANITPAGVVTGTALGAARIAVRVDAAVDTSSVLVTKIPVASVRLFPLQLNLEQGTSQQLVPTVTDSVGTVVTDRPIEWLSSDPTKARVSTTGVVTTLNVGTVNIDAVSENAVGRSTVNILLVPVDTILAPTTFTIIRGNTLGFTITVFDRNGVEVRGRPISLVSSRPDIAQVTQEFINGSTVQVQALQVGETLITIRAVNASGNQEGKASIVRVTVVPPTP
jgi:uncharacterized protein YjdB